MKRVLLFVLMSVMALFATQQMLAAKLDIRAVEVSVEAWSSNTADKIIDGSYSTHFESFEYQSVGTTATLTLDGIYQLETVKLYFGNYTSSRPNKIKLQVSTDNVVWSDVAGSEVTVANAVEYESDKNSYCVAIDASAYAAKYVRMVIVDKGTSYLYLYEFEVYGQQVDITPRTVSVSVNNSQMGTAYIGEEGVTRVENKSGAVNLVAIPAEGYMFESWTVNGEVVSTEATYIDLFGEDRAYVANFSELLPYNISVSENDSTLGNAFIGYIEINEVTNQTEPVLIKSQSYSNCRFLNWTLNGVVVSTEPDYLCTIPGTHHYVANFEELPKYDISIISSNPTMGSVIEINRQLYEGEEITLIATPNEGYEFVNWTVNGNVVSISPEYTFTVNSEIEYVAHFQNAYEKIEIIAAESSLTQNGNYAVSNVKDGKYNTRFYSQNSASKGSSVTVTLAEESVIGRVNLYFDTYHRPTAAKLQASTDNKHWYDIEGTDFKGSESKYHQKASAYLMSKYLSQPIVAKYLRMYITTTSYQPLDMREKRFCSLQSPEEDANL